MNNLRKRLIACFAAVFPDLSQEEIPLATVQSVASWDSLATLRLIVVIEEEFGVKASPDDLEQFFSFELILDYVVARALKNDSTALTDTAPQDQRYAGSLK